jgi:hypothetical protein
MPQYLNLFSSRNKNWMFTEYNIQAAVRQLNTGHDLNSEVRAMWPVMLTDIKTKSDRVQKTETERRDKKD